MSENSAAGLEEPNNQNDQTGYLLTTNHKGVTEEACILYEEGRWTMYRPMGSHVINNSFNGPIVPLMETLGWAVEPLWSLLPWQICAECEESFMKVGDYLCVSCRNQLNQL